MSTYWLDSLTISVPSLAHHVATTKTLMSMLMWIMDNNEQSHSFANNARLS